MFISCQNENIRYTGRWALPEHGMDVPAEAITATAPGAFFEFAYEGPLAVLHFDTTANQQPFPHLWIRVDGGARTEVPLDRFLRVNAGKDGRHTVEVIYKGNVEMYSRWPRPLVGKISFAGVEADAVVPLPRSRKKKTIEFVGDSITEGVLIDEACRSHGLDQHNRPCQDDVTATYSWLTAETLGLKPLVMAYGGLGVTRGACGGVPAAAQAYPFCFEGAPVTYPSPDYVFISLGTNDRPADSVSFTAGYVALLDAIVAAHPRAQVIAMIPFIGAHAEDITRLVGDYNERHGRNIRLIDGSHWLPPEPVHPGRDGHRLAADKLTECLREILKL